MPSEPFPAGTGSAARMASVVTGPLASWVGVVFWLSVLAVAVPFATHLGSAETSALTDFLPATAPSTTAMLLDRRFPEEGSLQAVIVFHRSPVLTSADVARSSQDARRLSSRLGAAIGTPSGLVRSENGSVGVITVGVAGDEQAVQRTVKEMRTILGEGSAGLEIRVTGAAGIQADLLGTFSGLGTFLLLATALLVALLLAATYRSPVLWLMPLVCVGIAEAVAMAITYALASAGLTVTSESALLVTVIVFGAGTDYALLITARYREELHRSATHRVAMAVAWRRAAPAITWSALTVAASLACLLPARFNVTREFGVVGIVGVASAATVVLGAYPALLLVTGRGIFWPAIPRQVPHFVQRGPWAVLARIITRGRRRLWLAGFVLLGSAGVGLFTVNTNVSALSELPASSQSVQGYALLTASFPSGEVEPVDVVVTDSAYLIPVRTALAKLPVTALLGPVERSGELARFDLILRVAPTGPGGFRAIRLLRASAAAAAGSHVVIGGQTAQDYDTAAASHRDTLVVVPLVLAVVLVVLWLVVRALLGPVLVVLTVVVTFGAALGIASVAAVPLLRLPGIDPTVPLLTFVFLVALGIDYNIFLLSRMREEVLRGDTTSGVALGVASTGGVLTSAGIILAGTFSVLSVLPIVASREIGIIVAIGVLADTFLVRTVLLPALAMDLGPRFWWPTRVTKPGPRQADRNTHR